MDSILSAIKKVFRAIGAGIMWIFKDDEKLYRAKSGSLDNGEAATEEDNKGVPEYDTWEEIRNMRMNFWLGSWVTRKFHPVGEDKLRAKLKAIEEMREAEKKRKEEDGD